MKNSFKLYLADDDRDDCLLFGEALAELSLPVTLTVFNDGESLLEAMSPGNKQVPDLVFLDINMPRKNGLECLEAMRATESLSNIPVVIFSTTVNESIARTVVEMGASAAIRKPSDYPGLKKTLQETLAGFPVR